MKKIACSLILILVCSSLLAQIDSNALKAFDDHCRQATIYSDISQHAASIEQLNAARAIADKQGWKEKRIEASITLAETMRKTQDFETGLEVLYGINGSEQFPELHVRKMGRLAAIYAEWGGPSEGSNADSVDRYLYAAIHLAKEGGFRLEEASLKNELGYRLAGQGDRVAGLQLLLDAAQIFEENGDDHNFVITLTNALAIYIANENDTKVDSVSSIIEEKMDGKGWLSAEVKYYLRMYHYEFGRGDSIATLEWQVRSMQSNLEHNKTITSQRMSGLRVVHETEKFQEEARQQAEALAKQEARTRELIIYLSILVGLVLGVVALLLRERSLKQKVDVANEKYHMLLVESNHRIKNNLQMIISMLQYASKDLGDENSAAFKRMSGKIHTISALHKHLYLDVHNERVSMETYFGEIITLYKEFNTAGFLVEKRIAPAAIKSERIVYFGLIFNEMLANTIEHNHSTNKKASISITEQGDHFLFDYHDGSSWEGTAAEGTGSLLIKQLIHRVGGTNYHFDPSKGLYQFEFYA